MKYSSVQCQVSENDLALPLNNSTSIIFNLQVLCRVACSNSLLCLFDAILALRNFKLSLVLSDGTGSPMFIMSSMTGSKVTSSINKNRVVVS